MRSVFSSTVPSLLLYKVIQLNEIQQRRAIDTFTVFKPGKFQMWEQASRFLILLIWFLIATGNCIYVAVDVLPLSLFPVIEYSTRIRNRRGKVLFHDSLA